MKMKKLRLKMRIKNILLYLLRFPEALGGNLTLAHSKLSIKHIKANGDVIDYGVVCRRKVTEAFVFALVDSLANGTSYSNFQNFKYHDCGTGTTAEDNNQTGLVTPYGGSRATGTQVTGGTVDARTYQSVATINFSSSFAITEHGLFNATTGGTLMDRSVFSAVNVVSGDAIQFTYTLTVNTEA